MKTLIIVTTEIPETAKAQSQALQIESAYFNQWQHYQVMYHFAVQHMLLSF
jgi:hypothetical protein